jgi:GNAT superfamily N-acetyltransferase
MPPLDPLVRGPTLATPADIDALNQLFSRAFTERYHRDGMAGVRVPLLNPAVWRYSIADAGAGAMVWRVPGNEIVAFNMVHYSGGEGWMGPLAVRTDLQGRGFGRRVVTAGIDYLKGHGATTIGLETMPRTVDNIGFYTNLGFLPGHLTVTLSREIGRQAPANDTRLSAAGADQDRLMSECVSLTSRLRPGADFTREVSLTAELGLGDTSVVLEGKKLRGFTIWHGAPLAADRAPDELRVLKLVADDLETARRLLAQLEVVAAGKGLQRITLRAETARGEAFRALVQDGFEVLWTDLRMTLSGYPEPSPAGGVVFSNWEI